VGDAFSLRLLPVRFVDHGLPAGRL
jgi:hypothetical protein